MYPIFLFFYICRYLFRFDQSVRFERGTFKISRQYLKIHEFGVLPICTADPHLYFIWINRHQIEITKLVHKGAPTRYASLSLYKVSNL